MADDQTGPERGADESLSAERQKKAFVGLFKGYYDLTEDEEAAVCAVLARQLQQAMGTVADG